MGMPAVKIMKATIIAALRDSFFLQKQGNSAKSSANGKATLANDFILPITMIFLFLQR